MTAHPHYLMAALVVLGFGASVALVPRDRELALMLLKDREFDSARSSLERSLAAGDRSPSTIASLARLSLETGDVDRAVSLVEGYVAQRPNDMQGRLMLGRLYRDSQRTRDYVDNLQAIQLLAPTAERQRELEQRYLQLGLAAEHEAALDRFAREFGGTPQDRLELAMLAAADGRYAAALEWLQGVDVPAGADGRPLIELRVSLLIDMGNRDQALAAAVSRLTIDPDPDMALRLAFRLDDPAIRPQLVALLEWVDARTADDRLVRGLLTIEARIGDGSAARARLDRLAAAGRLSADLLSMRAELSRTGLAQTLDEQVAAAERTGPDRLPPGDLSGLMQQALDAGRDDLLLRLAGLTSPDFLRDRPGLAAETAWRRGDRAAALRGLLAAEALPERSLQEELRLAALANRLGEPARAMERLRAGAMQADVPDTALSDLAEAALGLGRARDVQPLFARLHQERPNPTIDRAWALVAAAASADPEVTAWLRTTAASAFDADYLQRLYYAAAGPGHWDIALLAADRLLQLRDDRETQLMHAQALLGAGLTVEALLALRNLHRAGAIEPSVYAGALTEAHRRGAPVADEVRQYWRERLDEGDDPEALYALLDLGDHRATLPALRRLAARDAGQWLGLYLDTADRAGERPMAIRFLADGLAGDAWPPALREAALARLIDWNAFAAALPTLAAAAAREPGKWLATYADAAGKAGRRADYLRLLQELGRRPGLPVAEREAIAYALLDQVGPEAALPAMRPLAEAGRGTWPVAYEEALVRAGRQEDAMAWRAGGAMRPGTPEADRRAIAFQLLQDGDKATAERVFLDLAAAGGPDGDDLKQLRFLWGPRPGQRALDWLAARATSADGATRGAWLEQLVEVGGARRVISLLQTLPGAAADPALDAARIAALAATGDRPALAAAVRDALPRAQETTRLRRLAQLAREANDLVSARRGFDAVAARSPDDPVARRDVGMIAFEQQDWSAAMDNFGRYHALGPGDWESNMYHGETLLRRRDRTAAAERFARALEQARAETDQSFRVRSAQAHLLYRLGRSDDAAQLYAALLDERPGDKDLRADYATMLLEAGRAAEARRVAAGR